MSPTYFPGCTLSTKASGFDASGRAVAQSLGMTLDELAEWQCCGATFPLTTDNSMALIAPTRILAKGQNAGGHVTTLCAICFHVLRRTQNFLSAHPDMLERINWFTEEPYEGRTRVSHFLELLRDELTWEGLSSRVTRPLAGLKVAPYYGCLLLRPKDEIGLDDPDEPHILHDCLTALGCEVVDFPYASECCGSYLAASKPELPEKLSQEIVASARRHGAQAIVTACPLCQFNLDYPQKTTFSGDTLPVLYFTQLIAVALDLEPAAWGMEKHYVDPKPLFA
ncbi:MAG: CoB--CoM heterodisulfide reductase iron-sulfur subunit B family protein [Anaerolineales bacterium]|nr:CoB--CoM heterodisulfide reductase iron-sulfur subunit B family protein [Anaerolineales bacterium]